MDTDSAGEEVTAKAQREGLEKEEKNNMDGQDV